MGTLNDFDLDGLIARHGCRVFVEVGLGAGKAVEQAAATSFELIFAVEPGHKPALEAGIRHAKDHRITIVHAKRERGLDEALDEVPAGLPALILLAAPREGFAFGAAPQGAAPGLPIERELRLLAGRRDLSRDVLLIDELRLYEDIACEAGLTQADRRPPAELRRLAFIEEILGATHRIERSAKGTGYLCAFPAGGR